jgi:N-acetylmuramic acid 6-phosphate (MurNAc-6-P) etherase
LLEAAGRNVRVAVMMEKKELTREAAEALLAEHHGSLRAALHATQKT